jgi:F-type H+-transporting ATPase subunit b
MKRNLFGAQRESGASRAAPTLLVVLLLSFMTLAVPVQGTSTLTAGSQTSQGAQSDKPAAHAGTSGTKSVNEAPEAAGEDDETQFKHSPSVKFVAKLTGLSLQQVYWLSVLVNFGVVAGLIFWLSRKTLPGIFRSRTASIQKAMEEARKASQEASQRLADIETRLSRLGVEIGEMRAAAEKEAAAEEARIKAAAAEEGRKIVESAQQEIAAAAKSARRDLIAYAADLAVSLAAKQVKLDSATDQGLVRRFARQLSDGSPPQKDRR